jgi:NADH:flavin oxidoreductase/NADH oxidase family protein
LRMAIQIRLAPINTGLYVDGESTSANEAFFQERARSGVDICMVGNIAVSEGNVPNDSTGVMSSSNKWAELASAIRRAGSTPGIQLSATLPGYRGQTAFTSTKQDEEFRSYQSLFNKMTKRDWEYLAVRFVGAVDLAFKHGFDHVQIHAAHGYAFSLALDPVINPASVGIGPMSDLLQHLCKKFGNRSSLRVSWCTGLTYDSQRQARILAFWRPFAPMIELDLSNGYYNLDKRLIYPPHKRGEAPYLQNAITLSQTYPYASFIVAGNVWNPYVLAGCCPPNIHFAIARALIADPNHLVSAREKSIMLCDDCGDCHFFSTGRRNLTCPKWHNKANSADAKNRAAD